MGRRALRKLPGSIDLSRHFKSLEELPRPLDPAALFGRVAPLEIEVGCGKGLFLAAASAECPDRDFLGIELAQKYARFAAARLAKASAVNACVVHGDAWRLFQEYLFDASLAAVHVYFPDPWWKARHRKRRIMNEPFLRNVERTLTPGGTLHFWTDVDEYYETTLDLIRNTTRLLGPLPVEERAAEHDLDYRTHFERRMRLHGLPVYRAQFRRPL